jgi:hypothetical protein
VIVCSCNVLSDSKIRDCKRRTPCPDEPSLRFARLRGRMRPLRPYHQNYTRGTQTLHRYG